MPFNLYLIIEYLTYLRTGKIVIRHHYKPRYSDPEAWAKVRNAVLERDNYTCQKCGTNKARDAHHIMPKWKGGKDTADNLIAVCLECHRELHKTDGTHQHGQEQIKRNKKPHLAFCQCGCKTIFIAQDPRMKYRPNHRKQR